MISVLLVDDHALVRYGMQRILELAGDIEVVGVATSGAEALELDAALAADVVLMDVSMPDLSGIETTRRLRLARPSAVVVMLTASADRSDIIAALDAGAAGYLVKDADPTTLVAGIRDAASGAAPLDARAGRVVLDLRDASANSMPELTGRELEVLRTLGRGLSNKEIANELDIAEKTVKAHLTRVFSSLGVEGRTQAALWAREHLAPGESAG